MGFCMLARRTNAVKSPLHELVELKAGVRRVRLKIVHRDLRRLLLLVGQAGETGGKGVGLPLVNAKLVLDFQVSKRV